MVGRVIAGGLFVRAGPVCGGACVRHRRDCLYRPLLGSESARIISNPFQDPSQLDSDQKRVRPDYARLGGCRSRPYYAARLHYAAGTSSSLVQARPKVSKEDGWKSRRARLASPHSFFKEILMDTTVDHS